MRKLLCLTCLVIASSLHAENVADIKPIKTEKLPAALEHQTLSLDGATDSEIFTFMGRGKNEVEKRFELKIKSSLPPEFWTADVRSATLALAEFNRTAKHKEKIEITIKDEKQVQPLETCSVAFAKASSRCYFPTDEYYFLRVDPTHSYLAYARSSCESSGFTNAAIGELPRFDFRLCSLPYEKARKIAHVIWWLNQLRSSSKARGLSDFGGEFSTADGNGKLRMVSEGRDLIDRTTSLWADQLANRWTGDFNDEVMVNFSAYLLAKALPEHLGAEWTDHDPYDQDKKTPASRDTEQKRVKDLIGKFLEWFTLGEEKISFSIVAEAVRAAGALNMDSTGKRIQEISSAMPPLKQPLPSEQVAAELNKTGDYFQEKDPVKLRQLLSQRHSLMAEMNGVFYNDWSSGGGYLQRMVALSQKQFAHSNDTSKLYEWAVSDSEGNECAYQRLAGMDPKRHADVLEKLIQKADGPWSRNFFHELTKIDRARAVSVVSSLPEAQRQILEVSALNLLQEAPEGKDEAKWVQAVIKILQDPKSGQDERVEAIQLLVPLATPMRHADQKIDEALLNILESEPSDGANFTLTRACQALAFRGRVDLFPKIEAQLAKATNAFVQNGVLSALTYMAQTDSKQLNPQLIEILRPHLGKTNIQIKEVFWSIWCAGLRELKPELEKLSTRSSQDYEGMKAAIHGGPVSNVAGQYHLPRQILAIWDAHDALTRAKLLFTIYWTHTGPFMVHDHPERQMALKREMTKAANELAQEERAELKVFLERVERNPSLGDEPLHPKIREEVLKFSREAFGIF